MDVSETVSRIVKAARRANRLDEGLRALGYSDTPYMQIYGDIVDAIYLLIDEHTETLEDSLTGRLITDPLYTDDECAKILAHQCEVRIANDYIDGWMNI